MKKSRPFNTKIILDMLEDGKTIAQIATMFERSTRSLNAFIARKGLERIANNKTMVEEEYIENGVIIQKIKSAYAMGAEPSIGYKDKFFKQIRG